MIKVMKGNGNGNGNEKGARESLVFAEPKTKTQADISDLH